MDTTTTHKNLLEPSAGTPRSTGWPRIDADDSAPTTYENPKIGLLEIGMVPGKTWGQWLFHEANGGGALVIGYTHKFGGGELHLVALKARRFNLQGDKPDVELPGGFVEDGEAAPTGALRELQEETGLTADLAPVPGRHYIGNRAFFRLDGEEEGTKVYAFELTDELTAKVLNDPRVKLMSWRTFVTTTRDALSGMAVARLLASQS